MSTSPLAIGYFFPRQSRGLSLVANMTVTERCATSRYYCLTPVYPWFALSVTYKEYVENLYIARKMVSYPLRLRREAEGMCR